MFVDDKKSGDLKLVFMERENDKLESLLSSD
jgi:hypothetical protein